MGSYLESPIYGTYDDGKVSEYAPIGNGWTRAFPDEFPNQWHLYINGKPVEIKTIPPELIDAIRRG